MPTRAEHSRLREFEQQLLHMLAKQTPRVAVPVFVCTCMIAGMAWHRAPAEALIGWLLAVAVVLVVRWYVLSKLERYAHLSIRTRLHIAFALSLLNGAIHGASLLFFPLLSDFERAVHSMILIGMCAGAVSTTGGHRAVFLAYILPSLVPLALLWALDPNLAGTGWLHWVMAAMILVFTAILDAVSRDMLRMMQESSILNREMQQAVEVAESASRAKTRFLASASHDLRQPIQTLVMFAAALALRPLDERSRAIAQNMNEALQDLTSELDGLLDVSKLDANVVVAQPASVNLAPFLQRICAGFQHAADAKKLQLLFTCPPSAWVHTDRKLFERVVRNLIENAIKYTDEGRVCVSVERSEAECHVIVEDTGCGIAEAEQSRIFEEFYQINNPGRDRRRGLGLGLAIVRRLVGLLQIDMQLRSTSGSGTRFELSLTTAAVEVATAAPATARSEPLTQLHLLVVDDEQGVRLSTKALLEELGCLVSVAASTAEARARVLQESPDVLITDLRLAGDDDGIKTIVAVREVMPQIPVIIMTGETAPDQLRAAREVGADVIYKPVVADALRQELAKVRRR